MANIVISGTHANGFAMSSDPGVNGVLIYANNTVPCFLRGTMIATPAGEVAVQDLQVGDLVSTHDGGVRPIVWLGFGRSLVTPRNRCDVAPVIVRAGALADNEPCRDLHVTRHHAVLVGAALVPVEHLINGVSVLWNDTARVIEYYHIELDAHAVLRADGAPAESFREDGNAQQFQNTADRPRRPAEPPCLPVLEAGPLLEQAWRTVAARAGLLVPRVDSINADLHLLVDNRRIDGTLSRDGHWSFLLPAGFRSIAIASRTVIPSIDGANPDRRRLGVAVREITLWRNNAGRGVPLNHPSLTDGWHAPSGDHRWTKGLAMLPTETADWFGGPSALRLAMVDTDLSYRLAPTIVQKRANR